MARKIKRDLDCEYVRELFDYDADTGLLTWKVKKAYRINVGDIAGFLDANGYYTVKIDNSSYKVHRIVWLLVYGYNPENHLDHINKVRKDNRICNLRERTGVCNSFNKVLQSNNITGVAGVGIVSGNKYKVRITVNKECIYIGRFESFMDAVIARYKAELKYEKQKHNPNSSAYQYLNRAGYFDRVASFNQVSFDSRAYA